MYLKWLNGTRQNAIMFLYYPFYMWILKISSQKSVSLSLILKHSVSFEEEKFKERDFKKNNSVE